MKITGKAIVSLICAAAAAKTAEVLLTAAAGVTDSTAAKRQKTRGGGPGTVDTAALNAASGGGQSQAGQQALQLCNQQRAASGLSPLTWSQDLANCGAVRAQELVSSFSHTRPNGSDWYTVNSGIMYAENLGHNFNSAQGVVQGWMNSPSHKANILDGSFRTCGIAAHVAGGSWYWAQEFGY